MPIDEAKVEQAGGLIAGKVAELNDLIARSRKEKDFLRNLTDLLGVSPQVQGEEVSYTRVCPKCGKENPLNSARCIYCRVSLKK